MMESLILFVAVAGVVYGNRLEDWTTVGDFTDVCMDSSQHKSAPGPEGQLFNLCTPWKDHGCCTEKVSQDIHTNSTWYKMSWDHCAQLSTRCRRHFQRDLCFYECSPNVGPWLVKEKRTWRNEKIHGAPLCESDCTEWYNDCKDDMTCVSNWAKDFSWATGTNTCPEGSECKKFSDIFSSSKNFCEDVWDGSWDVVSDDKPCMKLWFDGSDQNNNKEVARQKAEEIVSNMVSYSEPSSDSHNAGNMGDSQAGSSFFLVRLYMLSMFL